ncbi:MAG: hypothetical protein WCT37_03575 [Patescibacteria group bacterium]|jgi:hypothetical protein
MLIAAKLKKYLSQNDYFWCLAVFLIGFVAFGALQAAPQLMDPDSFYHAKMALLVKTQGVVLDFPWLPLTALKDFYIDQHWFYHLLLVPFVSVLPPLAGLKLATAFLGAGFLAVFYWVLSHLNRRAPRWANLFFTLFLLLCQPFIFRLNLAKASALSLILLFLGFYFISQRKNWQLFILSWLFVYSYGGWSVLIVALGFWVVVNVVGDYWQGSNPSFAEATEGRRGSVISGRVLWKGYLKLVGSCLGGLAAGLAISPYFPKNLGFYWRQLVQIGMVNYQSVVKVGMEWRPYGLKNLFFAAALLTILLAAALAVLAVNGRRQTRLTWTALGLTVFFCLITLKSQRYVEYFVPVAVFFSALVLGPALAAVKIRDFWQDWQKNNSLWRYAAVLALAIFWLLGVAVLTGRGWQENWRYYHELGRPFSQYAGAAEWLKENTAAGSLIFHSDWDDFPPLFYYNDRNYYIAGLDPTFLYQENPEQYRRFEELTSGARTTGVAADIHKYFGASYFFAARAGHQELVNSLIANPEFKTVYQDSEAMIFKINE